MLEKIGLPEKPALRGNNWVVDASHCQGCSSHFTFINRKHHCRRCGGLFCNSCTVQRMFLRGQGESPVRICDPCKKVEEAVRLEKRYGNKGGVRKADPKLNFKNDDEVLDQISNFERASSSGSYLKSKGASAQDKEEDTLQSLSVDETSETKSMSPDELLQQALNEKNKYKLLKGQGKSEEALKAFKRGKELERAAAAMKLNLIKDRKKAGRDKDDLADDPEDFERKVIKRPPKAGKDKDLAAELKELGWSDRDVLEVDKKPGNVSLEGELVSLIKESSQKSNKDEVIPVIDKTEVLALKKKALALKREGKLVEAKEELKKAKILEKQLEEQELLAGGEEDSDDELSQLINSMDDDKPDELLLNIKGPDSGFDFDHLMSIDDVGLDNNFEVTDDDMYDPEMAAALGSLGWTEDPKNEDTIVTQSVGIDREALTNEIKSLKREALTQKRAGNTSDAMSLLKKAKILEKDLNDNTEKIDIMEDLEPKKVPSKSKIMIQRELLALKKKALTLKREGKLDEADEELKNAKVLEQQLEEFDNPKPRNVSQNQSGIPIMMDFKGDEVEQQDEDITDQDLLDPSYLSVLKNLGWNEEDSEVVQSKPPKQSHLSPPLLDFTGHPASFSTRVGISRRSKGEIQRELLGLKRKALALRRQGKTEEADEVLLTAKALEDQIAEMEAPKEDIQVEPAQLVTKETIKSINVIDETPLIDATKELSVTRNEAVSDTNHPITSVEPITSTEEKPQVITISSTKPLSSRDRFKLQQKSLAHKRQSLKLRREGRIEEAEAEFKLAKDIETQLEESAVSPSVAAGSSVENAGIEDLLDLHLLPALKSIGSDNPNPVPLASERQETTQIDIASTKKTNANAAMPQKTNDTDHLITSVEPTTSIEEIPQVISISPTKPLSGRERFKLQQKSLAHKRQSLKLRREGRIEEAEAEFKLAKDIETQLEESAVSPSVDVGSTIDNAGIEDLLDPHLLSALKSIGLDNPNPVPLVSLVSEGRETTQIGISSTQKTNAKAAMGSESQASTKNSGVNMHKASQERTELEEQIKAEKIKAVTLKRSGNKAEALDALRRAKVLEKKLISL